jgi:serine/threonine protein kinase
MPPAAQRASHSGLVLRDYRLLHRLGAGPCGEVYIARDEANLRDVVVKLFDAHRCEPAGVTRYAELARAAAAIPATGACRVHEVFTDPAAPFAVLELVPGQNLALLVQKGPLPWARARAVFARLAACLAAAHRAGLVHGDLKPGNVHAVQDAVRVLDFGVAALASPADTGHTRVHDPGSVDYQAPEQILGEPASPASDVYALGVLLFEAITGQRPFAGRVQEVVHHHVRTPPPSPRLLAPHLPPEAEALVFALLAKSPGQRPSAAEVQQRLTAEPADAVDEPDAEEHQTTMWMRPARAPDRAPVTSETVVLPAPSARAQAPNEVTLLTPGMNGEFLLDSPPRQGETTSVQASATVFVDRAALAARREPTTTSSAHRPRWRQWIGRPWPLERKLIALNVAFGACLLLALLTLTCD